MDECTIKPRSALHIWPLCFVNESTINLLTCCGDKNLSTYAQSFPSLSYKNSTSASAQVIPSILLVDRLPRESTKSNALVLTKRSHSGPSITRQCILSLNKEIVDNSLMSILANVGALLEGFTKTLLPMKRAEKIRTTAVRIGSFAGNIKRIFPFGSERRCLCRLSVSK